MIQNNIALHLYKLKCPSLVSRSRYGTSKHSPAQMSNRKGSLILLHLPFDQHSKVHVNAGTSAREAISGILRKRNITPEMCKVCIGKEPHSREIDLQMDLESLAQQLDQKELWVHAECMELFQSIHHKFVQRTFMSVTNCGVCRKLIYFMGYRCERCSFNFHKKCGGRVPTLCEPDEFDPETANQMHNVVNRSIGAHPHAAMANDILYSLLPSNSSNSTPSNDHRRVIPPSPSFSANSTPSNDHPHISVGEIFCQSAVRQDDYDSQSLYPRDRSSSAPNINVVQTTSNHLGVQQSSQFQRRGGEKYSKRRSIEDWEISHDSVTFKEQIGNGSFGMVYKADYFGAVAVKKLNIRTPSPSLSLAFKNEVTVLKKARHGNVLNFLGVIREPELAIVTQWCEGSSLYHHIHVVEPKREFEMKNILEICKQISQGMHYLHSKNVIHRDLKTNNIFLTEKTVVKIGDFGLATVKTRRGNSHLDGAPNPNPTGSILWMAPEVIKMAEKDPYTTLSDVYSFGVCLYELLSFKLPYDNIKNRDQILFMVGSGLLKPNLKNIRRDAPRTLRTILDQCIEYDRSKRPDFKEIFNRLNDISLPTLKKTASEPNLQSLLHVE